MADTADDIRRRLDLLETGNIGRPPAWVTLATLPAPPPMSESARHKYEHDQRKLRERYALEERARERDQRERDRIASEAEARRIANATAVAAIDSKLADLRGRIRPLEAELNALTREACRLTNEQDALQ